MNLSQVMVDKTDIIFDDVRFIEPVCHTLAIANTGQVELHCMKEKDLDPGCQ